MAGLSAQAGGAWSASLGGRVGAGSGVGRHVEAARDGALAGFITHAEHRLHLPGIEGGRHLEEGKQALVPGMPLKRGVSITDACIGWEDSLAVLDILAEAVRQRRVRRADVE